MLRRGCAAYLHSLEIKRKVKRMSATTIRDNNAFETAMNAVIIYDRFDFAAKAKAMLERAVHETGETTHWSVKPWRVDMLKLPPVAEAALVEAAEAHLILLAVRQVQSLLMDWLQLGRHAQREDTSQRRFAGQCRRSLLGADRGAPWFEPDGCQRDGRSHLSFHDGGLGWPDSYGPVLALCDVAADRNEGPS